MDATKRLGGANYVLWGGREGYDTLLNTSLKHELANFGRFLQLVVEHKHKIGFKGTILIEPKPHEPTKHQYDFDTATVYGFLKKNGLENEVKVNIEANHATLAGHSFDHEIAMADALGIFGSIDINRGDPQNGWDTDQFHNDPLDMTLAMYRILKAGGFTTGGFNFDAKVRRSRSIRPTCSTATSAVSTCWRARCCRRRRSSRTAASTSSSSSATRSGTASSARRSMPRARRWSISDAAVAANINPETTAESGADRSISRTWSNRLSV
jgi:xylose isomerase